MSGYWQIIKESYRREKELEAKKVFVTEKDFLPAALEILENPVSPIGRLTIWFVCTFFSIALAWSIIGKIDVVAVGQGKIVPLGQTKTVQSFETGVVRKIFVSNGSRVEVGAALIELDPTINAADITRFERELQSATLMNMRNDWLLRALDGNAGAGFEVELPLPDDAKYLQKLLVNTQLREYRATQDALAESITEKRKEYRVSEGQVTKLKQTLPLLEEQVSGLKGLASEGIASRFQYLEHEENFIGRKQDLVIEKDRLEQLSAAIRSLEKQKEQHKESARSKIIGEISDAQNTIVAVNQELIKVQKIQGALVVRSPVTGVVQQLAMHTIGGVVKSSEPLMIIVPEQRELQVEMSILNKDIGFVRVGQDVEIKLEAFPFTEYGIIHGQLLSIDTDAVQDEHLGLIFPARVSMSSEAIGVNGVRVPLSPGMGLTAEIKIGKRRLIEFVLAPLFKYKNESLRER